MCYRLDFSHRRWPLDFAALLFTLGKHSICSVIRRSPPAASTASASPFLIAQYCPWSKSASAWSPLQSEAHQPPRSGLDCSNHLDMHHLDRRAWCEVGGISPQSWCLRHIVLGQAWAICDRAHFRGYYAICPPNGPLCLLPDMLVFSSSGVLSGIPERPSLTP